MYHYEHTNHDIFLNFLLQNLYKLFLHEHNPPQYYLLYLSGYKNPLFQVTLFQ